MEGTMGNGGEDDRGPRFVGANDGDGDGDGGGEGVAETYWALRRAWGA